MLRKLGGFARRAIRNGTLEADAQSVNAWWRVPSTRGLISTAQSAVDDPDSPKLMSTVPLHAKPQLLLTVTGNHSKGVIANVTRLIFRHGGSVLATKKIVVEDTFAMMMSVYLSQKATAPDDLAQILKSKDTESALGFPISVKALDPGTTVPFGKLASAQKQRRLKLKCPQRPGIVLAITELLKDHKCTMSSVDADTYRQDEEIWFTLECIVELPGHADDERIEADLKFWTETVEGGKNAVLIFDKWLKPHFNSCGY